MATTQTPEELLCSRETKSRYSEIIHMEKGNFPDVPQLSCHAGTECQCVNGAVLDQNSIPITKSAGVTAFA